MRANLAPLVTRNFIFISQFFNIENLAELTPRKKKSQIYTRKNIQFFWVKKKLKNRKNKTKQNTASGHPIIEDYIGKKKRIAFADVY